MSFNYTKLSLTFSSFAPDKFSALKKEELALKLKLLKTKSKYF